MKTPPTNYRLLNAGELLRVGDLYWNSGHGAWLPCQFVQGAVKEGHVGRYARKLEPGEIPPTGIKADTPLTQDETW